MALPSADTVVDYPRGAVESDGTVVHVADGPGDLVAVLLDRTAFHPVDAHWPDQPADRGVLEVAVPGGPALPVIDAVVAATDGETLFLGGDVPVRTGTEGWVFSVAHLVPAGTVIAEGDRVRVIVDADHRAALSIGHTACHLASLALDRALSDAWGKPVPGDALGAPGFDAQAIETSTILERGSRDVYRIGKSLRRKGFDPAAFDDPVAVAGRVNAILGEWTASGASVRVDASEPGLSARRSWVCDLPEGEARIPCGGTHATGLADLGTVSVSFETEDVPGARRVVMTTTAG
ncbi:hypothetical protein GCM10022200_16650 [Microbacterium awajiense]|uniref:Metal-dependent hydrolase n=1 Tax=Microbacterium awajiense TaxID=415214 RepID=A0ABP7AKS9_9MICO